MSLSSDDKELLVRLHLEKAHTYLEDSEHLLELNSLSSAAKDCIMLFSTQHMLCLLQMVLQANRTMERTLSSISIL